MFLKNGVPTRTLKLDDNYKAVMHFPMKDSRGVTLRNSEFSKVQKLSPILTYLYLCIYQSMLTIFIPTNNPTELESKFLKRPCSLKPSVALKLPFHNPKARDPKHCRYTDVSFPFVQYR